MKVKTIEQFEKLDNEKQEKYVEHVDMMINEYDENFYEFSTGCPMWGVFGMMFNEEEQKELQIKVENRINSWRKHLEDIKETIKTVKK